MRLRQIAWLVTASAVLLSAAAAFVSMPARASGFWTAHSRKAIFQPVGLRNPPRPVFSARLQPPSPAGHSAWLPASVPAIAQASGWQVQSTPNPSLPNGYLAAVSCSGTASCMAVGDFENDAAVPRTLAMRWDGGHWRIKATPNPPGAIASRLSGVSCTTATACVAVGYYVNRGGKVLTLAERWNGARWSIQATSDPAGAVGSWLLTVTCTSARACTAVGEYENALAVFLTLAERWNGTRWVVQRTIDPAGAFSSALFGVSCTSARACAAVGNYTNTDGTAVTLAEQWNGVRWRRQTIPNQPGASGSVLSGVSCAKASACIAVGHYTSKGMTLALAEGWNGSRWRLQTTLMPGRGKTSELDAVWCVSASACTAAGGYTNSFGTSLTLAERWNGSNWALQPTPNAAGSAGGKFTAVSCGSAKRCAAVGYDANLVGMDVTMAQEWNGVAWRARTTPNPSGAVPTSLSAVSCVSSRECTAVGFYAPGFVRHVLALAERWNGTRWSIQQTAKLPGALESEFDGVSCASARACTAVGSYLSAAGKPLALVETWNGLRWSVQKTPVPAGAGATQFAAVSCTSASACTAVGSFFPSGGTSQALAQRWDGSRWRIQAAPKPAGRPGAGLTGVSCTSASACTSVGYSITTTGYLFSLAERWAGAGWTIQATPGPAGANASAFFGVSCTSSTACTAAGAFDRRGPDQAFADVLKGGTWSVRSIPRPAGEQVSELNGISCTVRRGCAAVGNWLGASEAWTAYGALGLGDKWTLQSMPMPAITFQSLLTGVSCVTSRCVAVGYRLGWSGIQVSLVVVKSWPTTNTGG